MSGLGEVAVEDKQDKPVEQEVHTDEKKGEGLSCMPRRARRVYSHSTDEGARTTDPEKMKQNIQIPVAYLIKDESGVRVASHVDPYDVFVISPEHMLSVLPDSTKDEFERARRYYERNHPVSPLVGTGTETIKREEVFSRGIEQVVKSKDRKSGLRKYGERLQRRKLRMEDREKRKAKRKEEREARKAAASRKPVDDTSGKSDEMPPPNQQGCDSVGGE